MKRLELRGRIMLAIGAGGAVAVACGGTEGTGAGLGADAASDAAVAAEGGRESAAGETGIPDVGNDALPSDGPASDVLADTGGDACAANGQPCTMASDCCGGYQCTYGHVMPCIDAGAGCICTIPSVRRPFLVGSSLRVASATERSDWLLERGALAPAPDVDERTAEALARDWLHDGCDEHASIAAFARFTMHLASVGAPPEMIVRSQAAAIDEVKHARACFALAHRYGGRAMGPAALALDGALTPMTLAEIAALTAEEGCVGETLGVLLAEEQLARTTDPLVRSLLVRADIVADEARHAELAWSFVSWAVARGGEPVRRAVAAAIRRAVDSTLAMPIRTYDGVDVDAWRAHGRLTCADARAVAERGVREVVEPCAAMLLERGSSRALGRDPAKASLGA